MKSRLRSRYFFCAALVLSWIALQPLLWDAVTTMPSAERLEQSRMVEIPTLGRLAQISVTSAGELAAVLLLVWPRWARAYTARVFAAAAMLAIWFIASTPLGLSKVQWVHRRWLAFVTLALLCYGVYELARHTWDRTRSAPAQHD